MASEPRFRCSEAILGWWAILGSNQIRLKSLTCGNVL